MLQVRVVLRTYLQLQGLWHDFRVVLDWSFCQELLLPGEGDHITAFIVGIFNHRLLPGWYGWFYWCGGKIITWASEWSCVFCFRLGELVAVGIALYLAILSMPCSWLLSETG